MPIEVRYDRLSRFPVAPPMQQGGGGGGGGYRGGGGSGGGGGGTGIQYAPVVFNPYDLQQQQGDIQERRDVRQQQFHQSNEEQRYNLQAQLQQTTLTQGEDMRRQRLERQLGYIQEQEDGGMMMPQDAQDARMQLNTGLDPLQRRHVQSQMLREQSQTADMERRFVQQAAVERAYEKITSTGLEGMFRQVQLPDGSRQTMTFDRQHGGWVPFAGEGGAGGARRGSASGPPMMPPVNERGLESAAVRIFDGTTAWNNATPEQRQEMVRGHVNQAAEEMRADHRVRVTDWFSQHANPDERAYANQVRREIRRIEALAGLGFDHRNRPNELPTPGALEELRWSILNRDEDGIREALQALPDGYREVMRQQRASQLAARPVVRPDMGGDDGGVFTPPTRPTAPGQTAPVVPTASAPTAPGAPPAAAAPPPAPFVGPPDDEVRLQRQNNTLVNRWADQRFGPPLSSTQRQQRNGEITRQLEQFRETPVEHLERLSMAQNAVLQMERQAGSLQMPNTAELSRLFGQGRPLTEAESQRVSLLLGHVEENRSAPHNVRQAASELRQRIREPGHGGRSSIQTIINSLRRQ